MDEKQNIILKIGELSTKTNTALSYSQHAKWDMFKMKMLQFIGGLVMEKNDEGLYVM